MATVIDALMVTLGLDPAGFKKGADEVNKSQAKVTAGAVGSAKAIDDAEKKLTAAQTQRTKELDAQAKHIADGFKKIRNEALGLLVIFTAGMGIKNFTVTTLDNAASLGFMAKNLDMTTERLSAYQRASERAGGSKNGITAQLKESADAVAKYRLGQGLTEGVAKFFQFGGDEKDLKDGNSFLLARSKIISDMFKVDPTKASLLASQMGISEDQFNLIKQGPDAILALVAAQEKNSVVTERDAEAALKLKNQMLDLRDRLESVATKILLQLAPVLESLMQKFQIMADWIADHREDIAKWVDSAVKAVVDFSKALDKAAESVGGWKNVLIGLIGLKVLGFAANLVTLALSLARVGTALGGIATFAGLLKVLGPLALLFHTDELNANEAGDLANHRAGMPGYDAAGNPTGAAPSGAAGGKLPRGMRNNNPGNIEYGNFARKHGATGSDGRFAIFPTMESGQDAMQALLGGYLASGSDTVGKAISKWAPSSENNTAAYIASVAKEIGVGADQKLNASNLPALAAAISRHENGSAWDQRNAASVANMSAGIGAGSRATGGGNSSSTSTTEVKIGEITVNTKATDAKGIANDIGGAVTGRFRYVAQANAGML